MRRTFLVASAARPAAASHQTASPCVSQEFARPISSQSVHHAHERISASAAVLCAFASRSTARPWGLCVGLWWWPEPFFFSLFQRESPVETTVLHSWVRKDQLIQPLIAEREGYQAALITRLSRHSVTTRTKRCAPSPSKFQSSRWLGSGATEPRHAARLHFWR